MARFIIKDGFGQVFQYELAEGDTTVGRDPGSDLVLPNHSVSRRHIELSRSGDAVTVRDLDSRNGITVNQEEIKSAQLNPHDVLQVGRFTLTLVEKGQSTFEGHFIEYMDAYTQGATAARSSTIAVTPDFDTEEIVLDSELRLIRKDNPEHFWFVTTDPITVGKAGVVVVGGLMSGGIIATIRKTDGIVVLERNKAFATVSVNGQPIKQTQLKKGDAVQLGSDAFVMGSGTALAALQR